MQPQNAVFLSPKLYLTMIRNIYLFLSLNLSLVLEYLSPPISSLSLLPVISVWRLLSRTPLRINNYLELGEFWLLPVCALFYFQLISSSLDFYAIVIPLKINKEYLPAKVLSPCCTPWSLIQVIIFPKWWPRRDLFVITYVYSAGCWTQTARSKRSGDT